MKVECDILGQKLAIESGELAKQANGSVTVTYGDTVVLATAVCTKTPKKDADFVPLTVDYRGKSYAAGKIPGGFYKREGRPGEKEILTSRLIDRSIRPLFPKKFFNETQVICLALSADQENDPDILSIIGASSALAVSDIPSSEPIGAVRIGLIDGKFIANPTYTQTDASLINIVIAGTRDAIVMVEGDAKEVPENIIIDALMFGHDIIKNIIVSIEELVKSIGKTKISVEEPIVDKELLEMVKGFSIDAIRKAIIVKEKQQRADALEKVRKDILEYVDSDEKYRGKENEVLAIIDDIEKHELRMLIAEKEMRADGRGPREIRPINAKIGILPRTHGSALFTRGETQALVISTLGTSMDEQQVDSLEGRSSKTFMLHYNFPSFCVGEVKPFGSPGRREIGHGALAERAVSAVLPSQEEFPYTIRVVSDILESNGSSSMATVCGASLSLMDAGVPVKAPVAGIAMGLIKEGDKFYIISDILGIEDHLGDMDFKVAGTRKGISAIQMDIKISGVTKDILEKSLEQAKEGRLLILGKMDEVISSPRSTLSIYAPRIITIQIKSDKVGEVIGPGGKTIKGIIEKTGATIDIEDNGLISISANDDKSALDAVELIKNITQEPEIGKLYLGKVKKIMDFGAFVEIFPGTDGLLHISELSHQRIKNIFDELKEGDDILVKVLEIHRDGKIRLSRKAANEDQDQKGNLIENRTFSKRNTR